MCIHNLIHYTLEQFATVVTKPRPQEGSSVEVVLDPSLHSVNGHFLVLVLV